MKITNLGIPNPPLASQPPVDEAAAAAGDQAAANVAAGAKGYAPSPELQHLIGLVRQQPEVRDALVQAAAERLQQGYYQTQASAEQTAASYLNALD